MVKKQLSRFEFAFMKAIDPELVADCEQMTEAQEREERDAKLAVQLSSFRNQTTGEPLFSVSKPIQGYGAEYERR